MRRYRVDEVRYVDEMPKVLEALNGGKSTLLTLSGVNTDSGKTTRAAAFDGISKFKVDDGALFPVIAELRVFKTEMELQALRYISKVSSDAHKVVMRKIKPGMKVTDTLLGVQSCVRFCQQEFGEFPRLVGRYYSYLLPKQARGTPLILVDKTLPMTGHLRV